MLQANGHVCVAAKHEIFNGFKQADLITSTMAIQNTPVVASNAGGTLGEQGALQAFVTNCAETARDWLAIFVWEADAKRLPDQFQHSAHEHFVAPPVTG